MVNPFLQKQKLFIYVLLTFISFIIIDTIIKFYYFYFLNAESNVFSFISFIVPYAILIGFVMLYFFLSRNIEYEQRSFVRTQMKRRGLPVRRRIQVYRIKKVVKSR